MLEYLTKLPCEVFGYNILGFLELIDIIQFENAAASYQSQRLLRAVLPYCPPIRVSSSEGFVMNRDALKWLIKRRCNIQQFLTVALDALCEVDFEYSVFDNIELCLNEYTYLHYCEIRINPNMNRRITCVKIKGNQDPAVMEVLFSQLSSVRILNIESSNLSQWMGHIKKIGPCLLELVLNDNNNTDIKL